MSIINILTRTMNDQRVNNLLYVGVHRFNLFSRYNVLYVCEKPELSRQSLREEINTFIAFSFDTLFCWMEP